MEQSLYYKYLDEGRWTTYAQVVREEMNGEVNPNLITYRHQLGLTPYYSPDLRWETINEYGSTVAADVIAMDSSIPRKTRDRISTATGKVPKMALEYALREEELTRLDQLERMPGMIPQMLKTLYRDTVKVVKGPFETNEFMYLRGLSTGIATIADSHNTGTGVQIDYGFTPDNKFGVATVWSNPASTPLSDFQRAIDKANADGRNITTVMLDRPTFMQIAKSAEGRDLFAVFQNNYGSTRMIPNEEQLNAAIRGRFGWGFDIVERSVRFEKNGIETSIKPWAAGQVLLSSKQNMGNLVWGTLAEMNRPVAGVMYTTIDQFLLVSKYRENKPSLAEFTSSQALVLPVINPEGLYLMDSTTVQA